jgi:hypothetical protein
VRLFDILALTIFLLPIATVPSLVLDSSRVNRQGRHLGIWIVALIVNYVANAAVLALGLGALGLAVNDVWVQMFVVVVLFEVAAQHIWGEARRRRLQLYIGLTLAFGVALILTAVLDANTQQMRLRALDAYGVFFRCAGTIIVWTVLGFVLVRPRGLTFRWMRRAG